MDGKARSERLFICVRFFVEPPTPPLLFFASLTNYHSTHAYYRHAMRPCFGMYASKWAGHMLRHYLDLKANASANASGRGEGEVGGGSQQQQPAPMVLKMPDQASPAMWRKRGLSKTASSASLSSPSSTCLVDAHNSWEITMEVSEWVRSKAREVRR